MKTFKIDSRFFHVLWKTQWKRAFELTIRNGNKNVNSRLKQLDWTKKLTNNLRHL